VIAVIVVIIAYAFVTVGLFASKTVLVPSSVQSYDEKLAADLWDLSADTAKLSRQPITQ